MNYESDMKPIISNGMIMLSVILGNLGAQVLMAFLLYLRRTLITEFAEHLCFMFIGIFVALCFSLGLCLLKESEGIRRVLPVFRTVMIMEAVVAVEMLVIEKWKERWFLSRSVFNKCILLFFVILFLVVLLFLMHWTVHCAMKWNDTRLLSGIVAFLRNPLLSLVCLLCLLGIVGEHLLFDWIVTSKFIPASYSFMFIVVRRIPSILIDYCLICFFLMKMIQEEKKIIDNSAIDGLDDMVQNRPLISLLWLIGTIASFLIIFTAVMVSDLNSIDRSSAEKAIEKIKNEFAVGTVSYMANEPEVAIQHFSKSQDYRNAFSVLVNKKAEKSIKDLIKEYPDDPLIGAVYLESGADPSNIENRLITGEINKSWYPWLLLYYDNQKDLSKEQKEFVKQMTSYCITHEMWVTDAFKLSKIANQKRDFIKALDSYSDSMNSLRCLPLLEDYSRSGKVNSKMVSEALDLSDAYPKDIFIQHVAYTLGSSFQTKDADYRKRTVKAINRFDKIFVKNNKNQKKETLANEKMNLAMAAMACHDYKKANQYLLRSNKIKESEESLLLMATCSDKMDNLEACIKYAKKVLNLNKDNDSALYQLCISSLKKKDAKTAIDTAGRLSELTRKDNNYQLEEELYNCIQYMTLTGSSNRSDYEYNIYGARTPETEKQLKQYPVLWDYMSAVSSCFNDKDIKGVEKWTKRILDVRKDYVFAWYLRGAVYYSNKKYKKAFENLRKAEKLSGDNSPVILYALANTCYSREDYEGAYRYCLRAAQMLPEQDQDEDNSGITTHNNELMRNLKEILGKE